MEKGDNCNFEIIIIDNEYKKTILTSFNEFNDNISLLNNINVLTIKLSLGYIKLNEEYNNLFEITIRPYSIVFKRLSLIPSGYRYNRRIQVKLKCSHKVSSKTDKSMSLGKSDPY